MHTIDGVEGNVERIAALFPNCVTERKGENGEVERAIDFDMLRQELSRDIIDAGEERYQFTWPGKRDAIRLANSPINATLRPVREDSVDFDTTQNLYIEGDNLDVLKLLRETYLGKVKMIYIDPPYNTGNDLVYEDDFSQATGDYLANSGQFDDQENRLVANTESNGRFHTDWLNMIYPRLKVARDLLTDDGVIFISIDNNEVDNAIKITEEIFGENNCLGIISNVNNPKGRSDDKYVATAHEYILVFAKQENQVSWYGFDPSDERIIRRYNKVDKDGKKYREIDLRKTGENDLREDRPNLFYYFYFNESTGDFFPSRERLLKNNYIEIKPQREDGKEGNWRWGLETAKEQINQLVAKFMPSRKIWGVMQKDYLEGRSLVKPTTAWTFKDVNSERGTEDFICLGFDKRIFPKPKPIGTLKRCIILSSKNDNDIILDFFSGSATTAHAVMQLNAEDGGNRRFIMVQLPEETDEKSEARKAGYSNICEIGKERIRRAGKKIKTELEQKADTLSREIDRMLHAKPSATAQLLLKEDLEEIAGDIYKEQILPKQKELKMVEEQLARLDTGFRVLRLDSSNMEDVFYMPKDTAQANLFNSVDNVKPDRTGEDLLIQVMLELGIPLSSKIESESIHGKEVYSVEHDYLIACFDQGINEDTITAIAKRKPQYFVMRDNGMATDNVADNFDQIFKAYSPDTTCKIL